MEIILEIEADGIHYEAKIRCPLCRCPDFTLDTTRTLLACANPKCEEHGQKRPLIKLVGGGIVLANVNQIIEDKISWIL